MAQIYLSDLLELIRSSPRYFRDFGGEVPAEQSLRIVLGDAENLHSEVFETATGAEVILDVDGEKRVWRIEIY